MISRRTICLLLMSSVIVASCRPQHSILGKWGGVQGHFHIMTTFSEGMINTTEPGFVLSRSDGTFQVTYQKSGNYVVVFPKEGGSPLLKVKFIDDTHVKFVLDQDPNGQDVGPILTRVR